MYPPAVLTLPFELVEDVLTAYLRWTLASQPLRDAASIAHRILPCLNVLPRSTVPAVSRVALFQLPWMSLDIAARIGSVWMLDTFVHWHHVHPLQFSAKWLIGAAEAGHVHVLEWWLIKRSLMVHGRLLPIQCEVRGIVDVASKHGRVDVMRWWKAHVLEPLLDKDRAVVQEDHYSTKAIDDASQEGHVESLDWWLKESGLPIKFSSNAIKTALSQMKHAVLDWWSLSGLDFQAKMHYEGKASLTSTVLKNKDLRGFQWLIANNLASFSDMTALCALTDDPNMSFFHACATLVTAAPAALASSQSTLTRTQLPNPPAYMLATQAGRVDMLNHLRSMYKLPDRRTILAYLLLASEQGHPHVLSWWLDKATALHILKFDTAISKLVHVAAATAGHINVLEWWSPRALAAFPSTPTSTPSASWTPSKGTPGKGPHGAVYLVDFDAINKAAAKGHLDVIQWFWSWAGMHGQMWTFGTIKKAHVCLNALKAGHADIIRWAATKRGFATIPIARIAEAVAVAARSGYVDAIEAYVEGFCHVAVHVRVVGADVEHEVGLVTASGTEVEVGVEQVAWWKRMPELTAFSDTWIMDSLVQASSRGDLKTLNWWLAQPVAPRVSARYVQQAMIAASIRGHLDCLDWWCLAGSRMMASGISRLAFTADQLFPTHAPVNPSVLAWWMASPFRFTGDAAQVYSSLARFGQVRLLAILTKGWAKLAMDRHEIPSSAVPREQVAVWDWWLDNWKKQQQQHPPLDQDALAAIFRPVLVAASLEPELCALDWWKHSSGVACAAQVPFSASQVVSRLSHRPKAVTWWLESGLLPDEDVHEPDDSASDDDSQGEPEYEDEEHYGSDGEYNEYDEYGDHDAYAYEDYECYDDYDPRCQIM